MFHTSGIWQLVNINSDGECCPKNYLQLEMRSMERGICPIAVFYFALKRSFFNI